jgi:beta-N-acetylhexosaminidase
VKTVVALLAVTAIPLAAGGSGSATPPSPTLQQLIGQKLVVRMEGKAPSASLLARARAGQIGGVIVHGDNLSTASALRAIASRLQQAAAAGGQPPLLIAVDQEGGSVKTVSWIPPTLSPPQMGKLGSGRKARAQGEQTGQALHGLGINTDFAPVADVPVSMAAFLYRQGRTWSFDAHTTGRLSGWFAIGLGQDGVLATAKHFPGLGLAWRDTDRSVVRISASKATLASGLKPFKTAVADHVPLIMLSNAVYTAYDRGNAAGWSRAIGQTLLRGQLGFRGATITDSLDGAANARHVTADALAIRAANAGTDLLLLTASEPGSRNAYSALLGATTAGRVNRAGLLASYKRILALKSRLTHR